MQGSYDGRADAPCGAGHERHVVPGLDGGAHRRTALPGTSLTILQRVRVIISMASKLPLVRSAMITAIGREG